MPKGIDWKLLLKLTFKPTASKIISLTVLFGILQTQILRYVLNPVCLCRCSAEVFTASWIIKTWLAYTIPSTLIVIVAIGIISFGYNFVKQVYIWLYK
ncbi:MAG: hypothetical protein ABIG93_02870 [archaeon]